MTTTKLRKRWLKPEEIQAAGIHRFAIIFEEGVSLRYPRMADDTAPTFEAALSSAMTQLIEGEGGEVTVSLARVLFEEGALIHYEGPRGVTLSLTGDTALFEEEF